MTDNYAPLARKIGEAPVDFCSRNEFFRVSQEKAEEECRKILGDDARAVLYGCAYQEKMANPQSIPYRKPQGKVYVSDQWSNGILNEVIGHEIGHQAFTTAKQMLGAHHATLRLFYQPRVPDSFAIGLLKRIDDLNAKMDAADKVHYDKRTGKIYIHRNFDLFGELEKIFDDYTNHLDTERRKWRRR